MEMRGREMPGWLRVESDAVRTKRQLERWVRIGGGVRPNAADETVTHTLASLVWTSGASATRTAWGAGKPVRRGGGRRRRAGLLAAARRRGGACRRGGRGGVPEPIDGRDKVAWFLPEPHGRGAALQVAKRSILQEDQRSAGRAPVRRRAGTSSWRSARDRRRPVQMVRRRQYPDKAAEKHLRTVRREALVLDPAVRARRGTARLMRAP